MRQITTSSPKLFIELTESAAHATYAAKAGSFFFLINPSARRSNRLQTNGQITVKLDELVLFGWRALASYAPQRGVWRRLERENKSQVVKISQNAEQKTAFHVLNEASQTLISVPV